MKNKIYKISILTMCILTAAIAAQAQFPNFTKVDTGAISQLWGGHVSSTCFDMDNDGDLDLLISNFGVDITRDFSIYKNERNGFFVRMPGLTGSTSKVHLNSLGDIDNDGDLDLFTGNVGGGNLGIYINDDF